MAVMTAEQRQTVEAMLRWHALTEKVPTAAAWRARESDVMHAYVLRHRSLPPSVSTVQRQFGTFSKGVTAAGLTPRRPGRQPNGGSHGSTTGAST